MCKEDHKGITALGYAIGTNRIAVVKLLLESRANPYAVDNSGAMVKLWLPNMQLTS